MKKIVKNTCLIIVVLLLLLGLSGCGQDKTTKKENNNTPNTIEKKGSSSSNTKNNISEKELENNVKVEAIGLTKSGDFAFKVINNNNEPVYLETVNTIFKDNNGNFSEKAESEFQFFTIEANSEVVNYAWGYSKDFSKYTNYEFECEFASKYMKQYYLTNNFEVTANNTGTQIAVSIKNNNSKDVKTLKVIVAYYANGEIVGCELGYNDTTISEGKTAYLNVPYPEDSNYNEVAFDNYEVYLMTASID